MEKINLEMMARKEERREERWQKAHEGAHSIP